jgi:ribonucleotide monophosphatase NagD (HAD superfamily)
VRALRERGKSIWLLDQFGVLHDGVRAYPCAIEACRELRASGARLFIISNSSRRAANTLRKLEPMGFDPAWFEGVVTSGEIAHDALARRSCAASSESSPPSSPSSSPLSTTIAPAFETLGGTRCVHFTWSSRGAIALDGAGPLVTVADVRDADFILAHGTEAVNAPGASDAERSENGGARDVSLDAIYEMLEAAAERNLPMVVANPDLVTVGGDAGLLPMPGTLARRYREIRPDADVILTGKPARAAYDAVFATMAAGGGTEGGGTGATSDTAAARSCSEDASEEKSSFGVRLPGSAVAVGDSLEHDVKGAAGAGVDSVFVCGGIHADELGMDPARLTAEAVGDGSGVESPGADAVARVAERHGATPTHFVPVFRW